MNVHCNQITIVCFVMAKSETKESVKRELVYLANMTRKEEGNINYDLHVSSSDDCLFIIYENWKNQAALDNHMSKPYLTNFLSKQKELLKSSVEGKICKIING
ncbi:MAG: hypothetical protein A2Y10_02440 [Planctomycetes bacterium GWF2_41_51]|nr:MAG: hypothetical protein A2Y10_02440 [Planctomycetes bacterium GWF2_41_51]HBG27272.1 antibiotic biosynthesis monooxygenase [Phycisphaerales bacterium]